MVRVSHHSERRQTRLRFQRQEAIGGGNGLCVRDDSQRLRLGCLATAKFLESRWLVEFREVHVGDFVIDV